MTVDVLPRELRPAVRAKGTVRPSEKPSVKSERKRVRCGLRARGPLDDDEVPSSPWLWWRRVVVESERDV